MSESIMLTGLPRSGTTLTCHLLNQLPDMVALVEPMAVAEFGQMPDRATILDLIEAFADEQHLSLSTSQTAVTRHVDGSIKDNLFAKQRGTDGLRPFHATTGTIHFDTPLSDNFKIAIKHPAAFTALLPELASRFPCYAIIRNPLSALASWNSTGMPVNDGHAPAAEQLDPCLKNKLSSIEDRYDRQLALLNWYFEQYKRHLKPNSIIRYEDIIESGGSVLATITPSAAILSEELENQNRSDVYDWGGISPLVERLLNCDGAYWDYYSRDAVREVLK